MDSRWGGPTPIARGAGEVKGPWSLVASGGIGDNTAPPSRPRRPTAHEPDLGAPRRRRLRRGGGALLPAQLDGRPSGGAAHAAARRGHDRGGGPRPAGAPRAGTAQGRPRHRREAGHQRGHGRLPARPLPGGARRARGAARPRPQSQRGDPDHPHVRPPRHRQRPRRARARLQLARRGVRQRHRANAAVGRAVRLALWNLGGAVPWDTDKATLSHPGEYAFCIAEEEEDNPWAPLHVDRGRPPGSDAVTVFACEGPHSVFCYGTPEEMLHVLTDSMCGLGNNNMHVMGQMLVVLNPLNAEEFAKRGWSKTDVRRYLWEHARRPIAQVRACGVVHEQFRKMERDAGRYPLRYDLDNPATRVPVSAEPDDIHLVVAGGRSYFAAVLARLGSFLGFAVTRPIRRA